MEWWCLENWRITRDLRGLKHMGKVRSIYREELKLDTESSHSETNIIKKELFEIELDKCG